MCVFSLSLSLGFLNLPELAVSLPPHSGLTSSFWEALLKCLGFLPTGGSSPTEGHGAILSLLLGVGNHGAWAGAWSSVQAAAFHCNPCFHPSPQSTLTGAGLEQFLLGIRLSALRVLGWGRRKVRWNL